MCCAYLHHTAVLATSMGETTSSELSQSYSTQKLKLSFQY